MVPIYAPSRIAHELEEKNFLCPFYEYNIGENRDRVVPEIFAEHSGLVLIRSEVAGASYGEISELLVC